MDCSLTGSLAHGILQARILEWVAMPSSRGSFGPRDQTRVSCIAGIFFTAELPGKPLLIITDSKSVAFWIQLTGREQKECVTKRTEGVRSVS